MLHYSIPVISFSVLMGKNNLVSLKCKVYCPQKYPAVGELVLPEPPAKTAEPKPAVWKKLTSKPPANGEKPSQLSEEKFLRNHQLKRRSQVSCRTETYFKTSN